METGRIKCTECDNLILQSTAEGNGGLCGQCAKVPESLREEKRDFEHRLASGLLFTPTQPELASSMQPVELGNSTTHWRLDPEFYSNKPHNTALIAIDESSLQAEGFVFLISDSESRLNLSFNSTYGVCEYQHEVTGDYRYAYTPRNLRKQVSEDLHVVQACPCCGVGMLWYPSRCHMPRSAAFDIIIAMTSTKGPIGVDWLELGDISHTGRGRG